MFMLFLSSELHNSFRVIVCLIFFLQAGPGTEPEPETGTVGTVFPGTEPGTGTAGIGFQEPKPVKQYWNTNKTLSFHSLSFWKRQGTPQEKQACVFPTEPLKSLEKKEKRSKKTRNCSEGISKEFPRKNKGERGLLPGGTAGTEKPELLEPFHPQTITEPNRCRPVFVVIQKPGNHPNFEKNALGLKRPFSEQLSEFRGILGAILGMALTT